ncbi:MAG: hypothetical protein JRI89_09520 [Deltaproteobacteria bacterium]|nr:hypothetical protein [Deltaproteobacteria bacterium]
MKKWALAVFFGFILSLAVQTSGGASLLYEFAGTGSEGLRPWDSLIMNGSTLYGMTENGGNHYCGIIFKIESNGTGFSVLHSFAGKPTGGSYPKGSLILSGSTLYGMTQQGGANDLGVIFKIETDGSAFSLLLLDPQRLHSLRHGLWGRGQ